MRIGTLLGANLKYFATFVVAVWLALLIAGSQNEVIAQSRDDKSVCSGHVEATHEQKIRACSSLIESHGSGDGEQLAILYSTRGAYWRASGDLAHAQSDQDEAIRLHPGSALLYFNRFITWQASENIDRALADLNQAIKLAPKFLLALRSRADLLYDKGDFSGAIRDYDAVITLNPKDARALAMRGIAKWQLGDGVGGKNDIGAAMRIDVAISVGLVGRVKPAAAAASATSVASSLTWSFKGSQITLKTDGANRRFYYDIPRPDLVVAGITAGTLLFEGLDEANQYTGKAFVFSRKCGPRSYAVTGPLETSAASTTITLSGRRPIIDADCHPTGRFENDVLVFFRPSDTHQSAQKLEQPPAQTNPVVRPDFWDYKGSTLSLVADGNKRKFYYVEPHAVFRSMGVTRGTLFFDGTRAGSSYSGTTYVFSNNCKPIAYAVSGNVSNDDRKITLVGKVPVRDSQCHIVQHMDHTMEIIFHDKVDNWGASLQ